MHVIHGTDGQTLDQASETIHYKCPICEHQLDLNQRSYKCENNHCFDLAKEGYVNLLPVQNKKSKQPGDNAEMIQARREFLQAGHYAFLAHKVAEIIEATTKARAAFIDIGCGEGYYSEAVKNTSAGTSIHGIDISKTAVKMSAKKNSFGHFSVASAYKLPYFDAQFDCALSIFSPLSYSEAARVLKPQGVFVTVGPGPTHMRSLAEHIYQKAHTHVNKAQPSTQKPFTLEDKHRLQKNIQVKNKDLSNLLLMTPYYWSCSEETKQRIKKLDKLEIELDFEISVLKQRAQLD